MSVKITYFVHGTTTDNIDKVSTGWIPGELSDKGIEQSIKLREQVDINQFDLVFCSDLKRSVDSAKLTFEGYKEIIIDHRIRECNYGDYNGTNKVVYEEHIDEPFPNGESLKEVEARMRDFCNYLLENYDGKHVALVCHRAPQLALQVIAEGKTWEVAVAEDWRKTKEWKCGWEYIVK